MISMIVSATFPQRPRNRMRDEITKLIRGDMMIPIRWVVDAKPIEYNEPVTGDGAAHTDGLAGFARGWGGLGSPAR